MPRPYDEKDYQRWVHEINRMVLDFLDTEGNTEDSLREEIENAIDNAKTEIEENDMTTTEVLPYLFPAQLTRTRVFQMLPHLDVDEYIALREELVRRGWGAGTENADIAWFMEGGLRPSVRRELAARGERY